MKIIRADIIPIKFYEKYSISYARIINRIKKTNSVVLTFTLVIVQWYGNLFAGNKNNNEHVDSFSIRKKIQRLSRHQLNPRHLTMENKKR